MAVIEGQEVLESSNSLCTEERQKFNPKILEAGWFMGNKDGFDFRHVGSKIDYLYWMGEYEEAFELAHNSVKFHYLKGALNPMRKAIEAALHCALKSKQSSGVLLLLMSLLDKHHPVQDAQLEYIRLRAYTAVGDKDKARRAGMRYFGIKGCCPFVQKEIDSL